MRSSALATLWQPAEIDLLIKMNGAIPLTLRFFCNDCGSMGNNWVSQIAGYLCPSCGGFNTDDLHHYKGEEQC